jgi:hypothetical protein
LWPREDRDGRKTWDFVAFADGPTEFVWLLVRDRNERAKAVYRKLGLIRFDPDEEKARRSIPPPIRRAIPSG